jgi:hypothetical protein
MRTYMCLEAHGVRNTNLVTQPLLKCCVYFFFYYYYVVHFFVRSAFRKLRVKFEICTNLGNVCSFLLETWNLFESQIGRFNGLESQSKQVEG